MVRRATNAAAHSWSKPAVKAAALFPSVHLHCRSPTLQHPNDYAVAPGGVGKEGRGEGGGGGGEMNLVHGSHDLGMEDGELS